MKHLIALALIACLAASATADDKPEAKKKRAGNRAAGAWMAQNLSKTLETVELTDEQKAKWNEAKTSFVAQMKELKDEGLTPELMKKRTEAQKAAREAGLKGKEMAAKLKEGFSEEEQALIAKQQKAAKALRVAVAGMLTPEQLAALPEQARKQMTSAKKGRKGKGKGKGKGKQKDDA
ncbi:putative signal peptide and transmembrane protein [Rhodopirellula islandica]|uniref:Signal peptide and transmembrane protein n=1 Tax=Rhodopirellula islandica TaxID=595434 RepID=A0A0J1EBS0_RHOIS|nr:Spy/CpxP family protein refolding chaperone [Rhodopirellula islandica]KLU02984.1 putative signal peptide and transmembrane protein [Rhodopirellula islandica]